jgi:hypothetical protein
LLSQCVAMFWDIYPLSMTVPLLRRFDLLVRGSNGEVCSVGGRSQATSVASSIYEGDSVINSWGGLSRFPFCPFDVSDSPFGLVMILTNK